MSDHRQPTIPAADWRRITIGCRDQAEVRRVLAGYREGYSAGQQSVSAAFSEAYRAAICTPQPPEDAT